MRKRNGSNLAFLWRFASKYKWELLLAFFSSLIYVGCNIFVPIACGYALDNLKAGDDVTNLTILAIGVCTILAFVFYWLLSYLSFDVSFKMQRDIRNQAMNKLIDADISSLDQSSSGDQIVVLITDITIISDGVSQMFIQLFTGVFTVVLTLIIMFFYSWELALVVFVLTPLSVVAASLIARGTSKTFRLQSSLRGKLGAYLNEHVENQKLVLLDSNQKQAEDGFEEIIQKLKIQDRWSDFYASVINPTTRLINTLIYGAVAVLGAYWIISGTIVMSIGNLMTFTMFTNNYTQPFNDISSVLAELQNAFASIGRVEKLLDIKQVEDDSNKGEIDGIGTLEFSHVYFSYDGKKDVLKDISFRLDKGMHAAIVGPTGCGKTTLINLVMNFYSPSKGLILIDGKDISTIKRSSLRDHIGMVLQDTWLFDGTVKENIAYSNSEASDEDIVSAAKKSNANFFIVQMENGYDSKISDASGISQGQKQLLCITRLMLKEEDLLILDEATSNLDTLNEKIVQEDFRKIMEGKTSIVIAHRLSTIQSSDIILVMKDGQIVEKGKHEELLKLNGFYSELYYSQFANLED